MSVVAEIDDDNSDSLAQDGSEGDGTVDDNEDGNGIAADAVDGQKCDEEKCADIQDEGFKNIESGDRGRESNKSVEEINKNYEKLNNEEDNHVEEVDSEHTQKMVIHKDESEKHDYNSEEGRNKSNIEAGAIAVQHAEGEKEKEKVVKRNKKVKPQKRDIKSNDKVTTEKKKRKHSSARNETVKQNIQTFVVRQSHHSHKIEKKISNNINKTGKDYGAKERKRLVADKEEAEGSKRG